jgi:hypothetical protein
MIEKNSHYHSSHHEDLEFMTLNSEKVWAGNDKVVEEKLREQMIESDGEVNERTLQKRLVMEKNFIVSVIDILNTLKVLPQDLQILFDIDETLVRSGNMVRPSAPLLLERLKEKNVASMGLYTNRISTTVVEGESLKDIRGMLDLDALFSVDGFSPIPDFGNEGMTAYETLMHLSQEEMLEVFDQGKFNKLNDEIYKGRLPTVFDANGLRKLVALNDMYKQNKLTYKKTLFIDDNVYADMLQSRFGLEGVALLPRNAAAL